MKIGFPTNPRKDIYSEIDWITENGFDFVDLFMEPDLNEITKIDPVKLSQYINERQLSSVGHTAWYLPIGSPLKELRAAAIQILKDHVEFFGSLHCKKMTVHSNWPSGMFSAQEGINYQADSLREIVRFAKEYDVKIMLEPIGSKLDSLLNVEQILMGTEGLFLHLDVGHANLCNRNPIHFINQFEDKLLHVHLHDNDGRGDLHNPLGTGNVQWKKVVHALKAFYKETVTLEIFSPNKDYILMSKEMLNAELQKSNI